jgi:formylglycine-generating enzyme required for sulfatase activity
VSWNDAQDFIRKLNQLTGQNYRLPSEAEWEYSARAGTTSEWSFGNDESKLGNYAWYARNSNLQTEAVSRTMPNAFGLYDMHGNVWEWVEDCWHATYIDAPSNGIPWTTFCSDDYRVLRGGSWNNETALLRSAYRNGSSARYGRSSYGFRLASDLPTPTSGTGKEPETSTPLGETKKSIETAQQGIAVPKAVKVIKDCFGCPEMVVLPAGSFVMGSDKYAEEQPLRTVTIRGFLMGNTEVTQSQWRSVMTDNPSKQFGNDLPVESVKYEEVQEFLRRLSKRTGQKYRLPSEAEWEYAARAGTTTEWSFGSVSKNVGDYAWFLDNGNQKTHATRLKIPNAFWLCDMYGNVSELTADCWHGDYSGAPTDGTAWVTDCNTMMGIVRRGGSYSSFSGDALRSASRGATRTWNRDPSVDFRVARDL